MINIYDSLTSEIHELEQMLVDIPSEDVIERMSFESRLKNVKNELAQLPPQEESDEYFEGEFLGILPVSRTFEFKLSAQKNKIIRGKIDRNIGDLDILNRNWLHCPVKPKFHIMQVGQGSPRYTLISLDDSRKDTKLSQSTLNGKRSRVSQAMGK
jgi:hypothetical protein